MNNYDCLKIEHQLCFPLYACAKEVVRQYKPFLDEIDLTYTQYITMMILWDAKESQESGLSAADASPYAGSINVKTLGSRLYLDSGTLTPLLKKLESKGLIERHRDAADERNVLVRATEKGMQLREKAATVPERIAQCISISPEEAATLYHLLYKVLGSVSVNKNE